MCGGGCSPFASTQKTGWKIWCAECVSRVAITSLTRSRFRYTKAAIRGIRENLSYLAGQPLPSLPQFSDETDRDFSQQFAFSLDFWWLYLVYLGALPPGVAIFCPLLFLTAAILRGRALARAIAAPARAGPTRDTIG